MNAALNYTKEYIKQYKLDNPDYTKQHIRKLYVKVYNDYKREFEPYDNIKFDKIKATEELILDIRKFVHIFDLKKDNLTIIDLFRIVENGQK